MRKYRKYDLSDYTVTKDGEIINNHNGRKIKPQPNGKGYLRFSLGGKMVFVHRLVAELYVPNPENKPQVNHKDGNKRNNSADNLEWVTNQENRNHAIKAGLQLKASACSWAKLDWEKVHFIRKHPEISLTDLAKLFKVTRSTITAVRANKSWKE